MRRLLRRTLVQLPRHRPARDVHRHVRGWRPSPSSDRRRGRDRLRPVVPRGQDRCAIAVAFAFGLADHDAGALPASAGRLDPREDAYTRLADTLKADAVAIKAEGDTELTAAVLRMRKAVLVYRDALATQGDTTAAAAGMADALDAMPC